MSMYDNKNDNVVWYYNTNTDKYANCSRCVEDDHFKRITSTEDAMNNGFICRWCSWCPAKEGMIRPPNKTSGYDYLVNMWSKLRPKN